jgi:UDP-N-acetyl-2-amino-2-deoxyglucuronate dehydrogenase
VYQNRYNRAVQKVRRSLEDHELGKIVLASVRVRWCRTQQYYDDAPWRGTWSLDGGAMTNQGIHYLDLLQYLVGDIDVVAARSATQLVNAEVEDTAVATLRFRNGALGVIEITTAARPADFEASVSVLAEKGVAMLSGIACNELSLFTPDPGATSAYSEAFPNVYGCGHRALLEDAIAEVTQGRPHPISFEEGTHALYLLNALYRSIELGTEVRLAQHPASARLGRPDPELERLYRAPSMAAARGRRASPSQDRTAGGVLSTDVSVKDAPRA